MNLDDKQVGDLFPDSREEKTMDSLGGFHLGIDFDSRSYVLLYTDSEEFSLTEDQLETMLDELNLDSVWDTFANRFKVVEYLRTHEI